MFDILILAVSWRFGTNSSNVTSYPNVEAQFPEFLTGRSFNCAVSVGMDMVNLLSRHDKLVVGEQQLIAEVVN
jgi:hypothetical protein